jgi:hypothetical protein
VGLAVGVVSGHGLPVCRRETRCLPPR